MKKTNILTALFIMAAAFGIPKLVNGTVWRVNNTSAYNQFTGTPPFEVFSDMQQAIGDPDVLPGDTLYVESSGDDYGDVIVNKRLVIIGTGFYLSQNTGLQANTSPSTCTNLTFAAGSSGSIVIGLRIADAAFSSIIFNNTNLSDITIERCFIEYRINFLNGAGIIYNNIIIKQNIIGHTNHTAFAPGTITGLIVTNNLFSGGINFPGVNHHGTIANNVSQNGVNIESNIDFFNNIITAGTINQNINNSDANIHHNLFSITQPAWLVGGNNNYGVPSGTIFPATGTPDRIFDPNPIGVCPQCYLGLPGGTTELGMFGGTDPYIPSGIPSIPTIYNLIVPVNAPQGGTMQGTISTRSNN